MARAEDERMGEIVRKVIRLEQSEGLVVLTCGVLVPFDTLVEIQFQQRVPHRSLIQILYLFFLASADGDSVRLRATNTI